MELLGEEKRIVELVAKRLTNEEIGKELGYSKSSIKRRLAKIYLRLEIKDRTDLIIQYASMQVTTST